MGDDLREAICMLNSKNLEMWGHIHLKEITPGGPVYIKVYIENIPPGAHGFHIHRSGDSSCGPKGLCSHYNPFGKQHGGLNDPDAHIGDLGNVYADSEGTVDVEFVAQYVRLRGEYSVLGRSFVVHEGEDDLGLGGHEDSKTTGHSGSRIMWGIIAVKETC